MSDWKREDKLAYFDEELLLINDQRIREFTAQVLCKAPDYFWEVPSSSSGRYHPPDDLGKQGLLRHVKRVVWTAYDLLDGLDILGLDRDVVISAAIIHDCVKNGDPDTGHTVPEHPLLVKPLMERAVAISYCEPGVFGAIETAVRYHYGPWSVLQARIPIIAYTPSALCVYIADYITSRNWFRMEKEEKADE
jgi:hypothetical protein